MSEEIAKKKVLSCIQPSGMLTLEIGKICKMNLTAPMR